MELEQSERQLNQSSTDQNSSATIEQRKGGMRMSEYKEIKKEKEDKDKKTEIKPGEIR